MDSRIEVETGIEGQGQKDKYIGTEGQGQKNKYIGTEGQGQKNKYIGTEGQGQKDKERDGGQRVRNKGTGLDTEGQ